MWPRCKMNDDELEAVVGGMNITREDTIQKDTIQEDITPPIIIPIIIPVP